jgi:hypothetical protein
VTVRRLCSGGMGIRSLPPQSMVEYSPLITFTPISQEAQ